MWNKPEKKGILYVVSAPSGTGKTTLVNIAREGIQDLYRSVSHTTRSPRQGEADGKEYHFVDRKKFESMRENGELIEWAEVFGNLYGTSVRNLEIVEKEGKDLLFVIDVQGARRLRELKKTGCFVFIMPPSMEELEFRLVKRGMNSDSEIKRRLKAAAGEVACYREYDYVIVNRDIEEAALNLRSIILAERCRNVNLNKSDHINPVL